MEDSSIINKVAQSSLITIDLEKLFPEGERVEYDLKDNLFQGLILREKDFREFIATYDWSQFKAKNVAIFCSVDAIIPVWAYMLLASKINPYAKKVIFGDLKALEQSLFQEALSTIDPEEYRDSKLVIKGCGNLPIPEFAYVEIFRILQPVAASIMYGEPCSTVPIYKKPKK
ncbi:DUF2480 family protein [soil metagenome]|jgi:hypothetical protein